MITILKRFMSKPITWGAYTKICIATLIVTVGAVIYMLGIPQLIVEEIKDRNNAKKQNETLKD